LPPAATLKARVSCAKLAAPPNIKEIQTLPAITSSFWKGMASLLDDRLLRLDVAGIRWEVLNGRVTKQVEV
jgi:hypothetical protein